MAGEAISRERMGILTDVYHRYRPELCRYISRRFGAGPPDPEDIVQQAFVRFAARRDLQAVANPRAYLYQVARNIAVDHERERQRHRRFVRQTVPLLEGEVTHDFDVELVLLGRDELKIVKAAILALPERDRIFLLLNRLEGVSFAEIARRTGMSASGVRLIVEQALSACQAAINKADRNAIAAI